MSTFNEDMRVKIPATIDLTGKTNVIGKAMLIPDIFDSAITSSMDIVTLKNLGMKGYLCYLISQSSIHKYIVGYANGTKIKHLDISGLLAMKHEVPKQSLLDEFERMVMNYKKIESEKLKENQQLASLRDFLLPMLMNGQVKLL